MSFEVSKIREEFPVLRDKKAPVYFDNACMTMKPETVLAAMDEYYRKFPACAGRSIHRLGEETTRRVAETRTSVARFIGARMADEIVFTRNTTEAINLLANGFPFRRGEIVLTTDKEHNSNLLPWQLAVRTRGLLHKIVPCADDGSFDMSAYKRTLAKGVRLVAFGLTSNWDGLTIPGKEIVKLAHEAGALVLFDAAQTLPHQKINVQSLDVDFLAASGHKMYGPTGTGFLYGRDSLLRELGPFMVGGGTIADVSLETHVLLPPPACFEAGLQDYAGIIGFGAATNWLGSLDRSIVRAHEHALAMELREGLARVKGITLYGKDEGAIVSFAHDSLEPERIAVLLEEVGGVMVRSGRHCAHVWANRLELAKGTVRASFALYNTHEEVRHFLETMQKIAALV